MADFTAKGISHPVVIVVSALNALIKDQIRRLKEGNVNAAILNVKKKTNSEDFELNFRDANLSQLRDAKYEVIFTHPASKDWSYSKLRSIKGMFTRL